jgi:uncharacterized protein (DUF58 family)
MAKDYEKALTIANKRHDVIAVHVGDPRESMLPAVGWVAVRDPETGVETMVNTNDVKLREAYADAARRRDKERDEILRRTKVDAMRVRTDGAYVDEIYRFFRMRESRMS